MLKQMHIILFGIVLLAAYTYGRSLSHGFHNHQLVQARHISDDKLLSVRDLFRLYQFLKRADGGFTDAQRQFQQEALAAHNAFRKTHCVSPLQLDDDLSRSAQTYAEKLASINQMVHSQTSGLGENLYYSWSSEAITSVNGKDATVAWYSEIKDYDFNNPAITSATGHFTQLVWKGSEKLGIGFAFTPDQHTLYVVAQYTPQGNILTQEADNILRPTC